MGFKLIAFILSSISLLSTQAKAVEIYSILTNQCKLVKGLILDVNNTNVKMLDLSGNSFSINKKNIEFLVVHNTLENPFKKIILKSALKNSLLNIFVSDTEKPLFTGWAVKFIEDLIIFYDIHGKTHVIELEHITKIRPTNTQGIKELKLNSVNTNLKFGSVFFKCPSLKDSHKNNKKALLPTRTLGDQVQISEFLSNLEAGFQRLKGYQERTYLYARPFLFEKKSKLGIMIYDNLAENPKIDFPFYFQWSSGQAYRFQSFSQIGKTNNEYLPTVEPLFLVRSDVKSHVFHASFVGNLAALPAGSSYYTDSIEALDRKNFDANDRIHTAPSFNYMVLMGGDYGPWSLSVGSYYPVFLVLYQSVDETVDEFREILASKVSPMFRLMFTTKRWKLRAIYSQTSYEESNQPNDKQISYDSNASVIGFINSFDFNSQFLRLGSEYQLNDNIQLGLDQIFLKAEYNERTAASFINQVQFDHLTTSFFIRHKFGQKVTLKAYMNYLVFDESSVFNNFIDSEEKREFVTGGVFEFVF